jgi:hypothetical protein
MTSEARLVTREQLAAALNDLWGGWADKEHNGAWADAIFAALPPPPADPSVRTAPATAAGRARESVVRFAHQMRKPDALLIEEAHLLDWLLDDYRKAIEAEAAPEARLDVEALRDALRVTFKSRYHKRFAEPLAAEYARLAGVEGAE